MGTKRVGLARIEALIENLKREINLGAGTKLVGHRLAVESVTADDALTVAESGTLYVFADAAATLTLPDSGAGDIIGVTFRFYSNFQGTGQKVVCADTTNEKLIGSIIGADTDGDGAPLAWNGKAADNFSSINLNSDGMGGPGSYFDIVNVAADVWHIRGVFDQAGGGEETPFAAT